MSEYSGTSFKRPLKIVIAHANEKLCEDIQSALSSAGHEIIGPFHSGDELLATLQAEDADVAISGVSLQGRDGLDALIEVSETKPVPAIIITGEQSLETVEKALQDHVMAYLIEPFEVQELMPTMHLVLRRFEQFRDLEEEAESIRGAFEDRKIVERAKGVLIATKSMDESEAHSHLQKLSKDSRTKLVEVAKGILDQAEPDSS